MKCLKCQTNYPKKNKKVKLNPYLSHLENWGVCDKCDDTGKYASEYYHKNKSHYRELHKGYKKDLTDSYVANLLADGKSIKAKDIPKDLITAKRQVIKINKLMKEK